MGDTFGPGGIFRGLRTVEALRVVAESMRHVCPDALLLNYANPMAVNCWATDRLGVRIVGLCHSVQGTSELLARELDVPYDEVTFDCAGVNHTAWFTTFRRGEEDLIPRIREVMKARHVDGTIPLLPRSDDPYESNERVRAELMMLTGYFHTESSHHASEYWAWFRKTPELVREYIDREWNYLDDLPCGGRRGQQRGDPRGGAARGHPPRRRVRGADHRQRRDRARRASSTATCATAARWRTSRPTPASRWPAPWTATDRGRCGTARCRPRARRSTRCRSRASG